MDTLVSVIAVLVVFGIGGYFLWGHYNQPKQHGDPIYLPQEPGAPSADLDSDEILSRLLRAIDRRDYSVIEVYASALFRDRDDIDLDPAIEGLRDPVIRAAHDGDVQLFNALLVAKPAFGARDGQGRRPIHIAAENNRDKLVRWLHDRTGVEIDDPMRGTGQTPLHLACSSGSHDALRALIELGADPNRQTLRGRNVMHTIAQAGSQGAIALLSTSLGRDQLLTLVNTKDSEGATPLHFAAESGNVSLTQSLLQLGAEPKMRDNSGYTPAQYAARKAHDQIIELLSN